jgi:hypothetical protein
MSKRLRSAKLKHRRSAAAKMQQNSISPPSTITTTNKQQLPDNNMSMTQNYNSHYQYLRRELRQIGILAGAIILILVVLSFILG